MCLVSVVELAPGLSQIKLAGTMSSSSYATLLVSVSWFSGLQSTRLRPELLLLLFLDSFQARMLPCFLPWCIRYLLFQTLASVRALCTWLALLED